MMGGTSRKSRGLVPQSPFRCPHPSSFLVIRILCLLSAVTLAIVAPAVRVLAADSDSGKPEGLELGDRAPDFELPGVDGKTHTLDEYDDAKLLLIIFTCNHCPTAQAYEERIKKLDAEYGIRGVKLVAISPNDPDAVRPSECGWSDVGDSLEDMKFRAKDAEFEFPYLYDGETQETSRAYGAVATPHVFLFDEDRRLRYTGRIDDEEVETVTDHTTRNAIDALLAGKEPPITKTRVFGCSVKWSDKAKAAYEWIAKQDAEEVTVSMIDEAGIKKLVANKKDESGDADWRLVNLWATYCVPCMAELPEFEQLQRQFSMRSFEVVTISLDSVRKKDDVAKLLKKLKVSVTNYQTTMTDLEAFAEAFDPKFDGGLPYTVLIAPGGKIAHRVSGEIDPSKLRRDIVEHIGRTYAARR